ncbi:aminoglycoside phosphotransferase family protein [Candidatus Woesearchaeota archaeon]|nr:aminoglycoside phosphotransferase family protein [Candidatus Woesearchaeota archaeon]
MNGLAILVGFLDAVTVVNAIGSYYFTNRDVKRRMTSILDLLSVRDQAHPAPGFLNSSERFVSEPCGTISRYGGYVLTSNIHLPDDSSFTLIQKNVPSRFAHTLRGAAAQKYIRSHLDDQRVPLLVDVSTELGAISEGRMNQILLTNVENGEQRNTLIRETLDTLIEISVKEKSRKEVSNLGNPHFTFADYVDVVAHEFCAPPRSRGKTELGELLTHRYNQAAMRYYDLARDERPRLSRSQYLALPARFREVSFDQFDAIFQEHWSGRLGSAFKVAYDLEVRSKLKHDEFVHGDLHPYNVLVPTGTKSKLGINTGDANITLIDWDRAGYGDLFAELTSFIQYSSLDESSRAENEQYLDEKLHSQGIIVSDERRGAAQKEHTIYSLYKITFMIEYLSSQHEVEPGLVNNLKQVAQNLYSRSLEVVESEGLRNAIKDRFGVFVDYVESTNTSYQENMDSRVWSLIMQSLKPVDETELSRIKRDVDEKIFRRYARTQALESGFRMLGYSLAVTHGMMGMMADEYHLDSTPFYATAVMALVSGFAVGGGVRKYLHKLERD